jgi:hypothetical protein
MKRKILLLLVSMIFNTILFAQPKVCYSYDNAGNRINRTICLKSIPVQGDSTAVTQPITENLGEMAITLYPNPTKGQLTIKVTNLPDDAKAEIVLSDMTGRLLLKQSAIKETTRLDLSSHPSGIYVLKIRIGDKVSEWKVIKE